MRRSLIERYEANLDSFQKFKMIQRVRHMSVRNAELVDFSKFESNAVQNLDDLQKLVFSYLACLQVAGESKAFKEEYKACVEHEKMNELAKANLMMLNLR